MSIGAQEIESWLRDRAAEALRIPAADIDPSRPLIDQGLDSLGAIELGQAVETALGVELPPGVLLEGASLKDLAPLAPAQGQQGRQGQQGQQEKESLGGRATPLSPTQRGLWFLHRLHPTSTAYHLSTLTRVLGEVTNADLRATFQAMVDRHPALRTTFPLVGDEPVQVIPEQGELAFAEIDAAGWSDTELRSRMEEEAFRPFDLERGPIFRAALFDRGIERFLVAGMHHIVSDFGALVNLLQEAPREGTRSFAQFVEWQAEMLAGPEGARLEAFWRERLAGLPELDLPADRVKPANAPEQGGAAWREIGAATLVRLKALARSRGATLYVVLLAAFQAYLHRITGQEDFAVGSPVAGRPAGFGRVFGYFTNPVVLRAEMEGDPPFRELVDRARRRVVEALDNQHFPLPLLIERLGARSELFRVLFVLHRAPAEAGGLVAFSLGEGGARLRLNGFELESLPVAPQGSQFDVTLAAGERHGSLGLQIIYDAARFDATTIARWLQHLDNLLAGAAAQPETPLSELSLLSPWERHQLLHEANDGSDAGLGDLLGSTLHESFERQAAKTPSAVALIDGARRLTYEELNARSSALAEELRQRGAGPESVVAVKLPRTAELIVALLGVLKAGAAYLPLDPAYPEERIAFMVEDAGAGVVVEPRTNTDEHGLPRTEDAVFHVRARPCSSVPVRAAGAASLAYLIYTSGSTGRPKGVAIEHAAAVRLVSWAGQAFSADELRGVLAATSVNFDLSIFEIFVPLSFGGTVILAENALALPELPARGAVTLINTVPSAIAGLLEMGPLPASVRTVNLAGEPLRRALADQVLATGVRLWDLYGPSEDTTYSTGAIVETGDPSEPVIGWPLAGSRAFVLDREFRPLPLGVPGELCLGGGGLARGYLGRAALTAEKFIPSPFGEEPGARLYRTGDLVRRRFDGALEYLGRIDHQVKIRGFRIELGEVEAALLAAPGVREAVVVAREGSLVAYVALSEPPPPLPGGGEVLLREALRERLPAPFVPSVFVLLDALPRTPNGKVDRKALPVPEIVAESSVDAPAGPVEEAVAAVWAGVLGRDRIGRSERFFDLGGHSLLATRVMARLRETLGVDLPLTVLFDAPTVAGLAARIAVAQAGAERPLAPVPRDRPLPLSFAQQRLWFLDRLEPETGTYNVPLAVRLEGALSRDLLARALGEVARRHEAVRTTYEARGGDPVQIVHPPAPVPVPLVDLQALPEAARTREARRLAQEEELRPFDLERGPVLRAGLLRLAPEEHVLLVTLHHIACDEWSIRLLFREVVTLVAAWSDGGPAVLPALPVQYADFAVWQRERLAGPVLASQLAYWRSRLADPPTLELPTDRPRPPHQTFRGARLPFALPAETAAALLAICRDRSATPFMTLLAAFQALLARTAGQTDLTVGTPISGRTRVEVESLIGFFLNTLVLRADLSGDPGFAEIVDRTRARVLEAFAHQDLPFEKLVDEVGVERSLGHSPLFQALFVLLHTAPLSGEPTSLRVEPFAPEGEGATAKFDLTLAIAADGEALTGVIEYNADLFDRTTALRLAERFRVLCAGAAQEPHRPLAELPVLSEPEAHQILREHNDRPPRHALPCLGRPVAGVSAFVLDAALQPAPLGVPGELALGGFSPARGYLDRPDQTAETFIPDPWSDVPGARLYRSGDRARLLPDGRIELLGRLDQQVKIRGSRVEPGAAERIVPRDPVEEMVAAVWSEILGIAVDRIGARDDFFALGGHSLLATRIVSRLGQAFDVEIRLRDLLERPTVEALAGHVRNHLGDTAAARVAPALAHRPTEAAPLSFAQLRLWIIDRIEPGTATYNVPLAVRLDGELDSGLLARAFGEVARRHEAVRTTFGTRGGNPVQIVHPPAPVPVPVADLAALPDAVRAGEVRRLAREEEVRPFDLERGPVLRAGLLRLAPAEHVLLLTLHHIACDEWSLRLLFHEVVTLLAAWREGRSAVLPALPVQYADFAAWQREWLSGPVLESQLAFWRTRLGDPPVLELPTDRPRPPLQTFRGAWLSFDLPDETSAALFALSHRRGATAFMTLLAAFQALLARTSGQTDLTVGTPITGRTRVEVENLIGFFLNTLVLRADLSGDPGFGEIVDRTRARALEAFAHQDLPFEKLVDEIGVRRSLGHSPLFQALFVLLHATPSSTASAAEAAGLRVEPLGTGGATAKFDLTLSMRADGESLSGVIEYNTDLFDRTTALRFAERFRVLCAAAAREPHRPLADLPVLSEPEAHQILREHNDRPPRHDVDIRLPDLIAARAEKEPERIAVEWPEGSWTYAEFVGRARELADRLRALGVGPDVPVAVSAGRGPELPLAFLAVLEAGGAYLPIDPAWPRERQDFMVADAGAVVVVEPRTNTDEHGLPRTENVVVHVRARPCSSVPVRAAGSSSIAYLIYTSGSTGRPKGVAVPHRVLTNLILWQIDPERRGGMPGPWRTLQLSSPSFDVSLQEMLSTWCAGGTLVLCSEEDRRDPERLARLLAEAGIERLFLPYVALQQLADRLARPETPVPSRLRRVITAGEQLQVTPQVAEAFRRLSAATGGTALHNHYGPSETHVVTELILEGDPARWPALPSIGRPVAGTSAFVLDRALKPMPIGVPGELALGGFSPARGYLGRLDQTAEKFIPDAWSGEPGARLYRSGDLARLLPDGAIELLGRIDHQVKIRGYRIEPGEIEAVLATHPRIRECAVAVREDRPGDRRLIAWVVAGGDVAPTELRDHLRARLPEPMVPTAFVKLDALPLTPTGKVQRSALPAPEGERLAAAPYVEPGTALEREIAAIFRDELALDRVGRDDNFFDLGGHSLTMVRAAARLTERLGRPVAVLDLFRTPTVASLARQLGGEEEALPARETLEERAEARRQSLSRRRELRRGR